jgi:hypothetical protein
VAVAVADAVPADDLRHAHSCRTSAVIGDSSVAATAGGSARWAILTARRRCGEVDGRSVSGMARVDGSSAIMPLPPLRLVVRAEAGTSRPRGRALKLLLISCSSSLSMASPRSLFPRSPPPKAARGVAGRCVGDGRGSAGLFEPGERLTGLGGDVVAVASRALAGRRGESNLVASSCTSGVSFITSKRPTLCFAVAGLD